MSEAEWWRSRYRDFLRGDTSNPLHESIGAGLLEEAIRREVALADPKQRDALLSGLLGETRALVDRAKNLRSEDYRAALEKVLAWKD